MEKYSKKVKKLIYVLYYFFYTKESPELKEIRKQLTELYDKTIRNRLIKISDYLTKMVRILGSISG
jgi:ribosomal protein S17E